MNLQRPAAERPATYQDVLDAPPHLVAQILRGTLHLHPRPASPHARAGSVLGGRIGGPFDFGEGGPGGWWILFEPELHLGAEVVVPDLAGWRRARMPRVPRAPYFTQAPDWVCEVLSPSTRGIDVGPKRAIYREHGVGHLWLVDPDARSLEVFVLREGAWVEAGTLLGEGEVRMPPFEAVGFPLEALWLGDGDGGETGVPGPS